MEKLHFEYQNSTPVKKFAHVGVVASGDLEILVYPADGEKTTLDITTGSDGFEKV
ncbi:malonate decarboxylase acyl carrier protein, partial [Lactobacillus sp. UMNPBX8]